MYCENESRSIDAINPQTGNMQTTSVLNLLMADEGGAIQVTLWRETAEVQCPMLQKAMDEVHDNACAKLTLTHMIVKDPRNTALQSVKVLQSTEKNCADLDRTTTITHGPRHAISYHRFPASQNKASVHSPSAGGSRWRAARAFDK